MIGDWVWLRLLHRPMASLEPKGRGKLGPKYFGPYKITERIGDVAYRLDLPAGARIHDVFHVGLLKKFYGTPPAQVPSLPPLRHGRVCLEPLQAVRARVARGRHQILVQWKDRPAAEATWEDLEDFRRVHPSFQLGDELLVQGGRDVMVGIHYSRHRREGQAGSSTSAEAEDQAGSGRAKETQEEIKETD